MLMTALAFLALMALTAIFALPAQAKMANDGPVNPENGYPFWYEDANGTRLELCLDPRDQMCLQPFESPDPTGPVSFPDNFPGESFWWAADSEMVTNGGGDAQLVMAMEAAFGSREEVRAGDQMAFGRIRVRVDNLVIGEEYTVTHPYGTDTFIAEDNGRTDERRAGEINVTEDLGCAGGVLAPCKWDELVVGKNRVGPFLKWDEGAPAGYVGNPNVLHEVTGSPITDESGAPQNYFEIEAATSGGRASTGYRPTSSPCPASSPNSGWLPTCRVEPSMRSSASRSPQTTRTPRSSSPPTAPTHRSAARKRKTPGRHPPSWRRTLSGVESRTEPSTRGRSRSPRTRSCVSSR
jgi:hypothetical protein